MKRAKRKEITRTNQQCLTQQEDENNPSSIIIPLDLIIEILLRIPAKSIARLVLVSKQWLSIIRGKEFTKLYIARSSTRPRLLVTGKLHAEQLLQTCSQDDPSSDRHKLNINPNNNSVHVFSPPIRGLVCRKMGSKVILGNPSTGQLLTLPRVNTKRSRGILSFLGYDPLNDVYKVLCMTVLPERRSRYVSEEHQVYTLGVGGQRNWRMVECKHPHLPPSRPGFATKGLCINGILYYYAWVRSKASLISFDLISEEFNVIKLPEDSRRLVNYTGKVAMGWITIDGALDLWVLVDASKQEWSKVSIVVPCWRDLAGTNGFRFKGTLGTGELIFSPTSYGNYHFISYDPKENNAKKVVVVEGNGDPYAYLEVYFDHVESPMFLSL